MTRTVRRVMSIGMIVGLSSEAYAGPVTLTILGRELTVAGEFVNGAPVPIADQEFAPLFAAGRSVTATVTYDTNQPDVDPNPNTGTFRVGTLSVVVPELGLTATRASNAMQISAFNDDPVSVSDQFFVAVNGVDTFASNVGLPVPFPDTSFDILLTGPTSMLANGELPTSPFAWVFGNLSFNFLANDGWRLASRAGLQHRDSHQPQCFRPVQVLARLGTRRWQNSGADTHGSCLRHGAVGRSRQRWPAH